MQIPVNAQTTIRSCRVRVKLWSDNIHWNSCIHVHIHGKTHCERSVVSKYTAKWSFTRIELEPQQKQTKAATHVNLFFLFQPDINKTKCLPQPVVNVDRSSPLILFTMSISATGLICTLLILILFVTRKDHPVIKASSRGLSCLLLVGIMISYGESFLDLIAPGNLTENHGPVVWYSITELSESDYLRRLNNRQKANKFLCQPTIWKTRMFL